MKPIPDKTNCINNEIMRIRESNLPGWDKTYTEHVIDLWESIRPKDQATPGLQWRPVTDEIKDRYVIAFNPDSGDVCNYSGLTTKHSGGYTHYLDHSELAALPLMPAPKPTPEEIERAEIEKAWMDQGGDRAVIFDDFAAGWKAAKKGLTAP